VGQLQTLEDLYAIASPDEIACQVAMTTFDQFPQLVAMRATKQYTDVALESPCRISKYNAGKVN
jgi:hypothetical protein